MRRADFPGKKAPAADAKPGGRERPVESRASEVRPGEGVALKDGEPLPLTRTEFMILALLASAPRRVFTREILLDEIWGYDYFGDSRLVDHIRRLRSKVEDDPANPAGFRPFVG